MKACDLHEKIFPANMVDTRKTEIVKVYVERKEDIEDKDITMTLFNDPKADSEGLDVCASCLQEKILDVLQAGDNIPAWKNVSWHKETMTKKDGSGTYEKNVKTVRTSEEVKQELIAQKRAK